MKWISAFFILFFTACEEGRGRRGDYSPDRQEDSRDLEDSAAEVRERNRLTRDSEEIVDSFLEGRDSSGSSGSYEDYDGPECRESEECKAICADLKSSRSRCHRQPESLVRDIKAGLFELISISEVDSVEISPALFFGILDMDKDLVTDLIEDQMSEGDLKSFLAWIAINEDIASALKRADRSMEVLEKAFEELGKLQTDSTRHIRSGLNTGLIATDDTFFYLSSDTANETAFIMAHEILEDRCSGKACKMEMYCARNKRTRSGNRHLRDAFSCRAPENSRRRSSRESLCYIHGSDVWSYLYELITDDDIRDSDLSGFVINVDKCKRACGDKNSKKCPVVL